MTVDESEIPEWGDERLNEFVHEWAQIPCSKVNCVGVGSAIVYAHGGSDNTPYSEASHRSTGWQSPTPDYCNDDEAFALLLQRMPDTIALCSDGLVMAARKGGWQPFHEADDVKRALAETAAKLAVRGIEAREATNE